jgi:hypothetical protein
MAAFQQKSFANQGHPALRAGSGGFFYLASAVSPLEGFAGATANRRPLWLWWHLLSLDAPTVAVVWALSFARSVGIALPTSYLLALGACVWLIYAADRILDGLFPCKEEPPRSRHEFYTRHRIAASICGAGILSVLGYLFFWKFDFFLRQAGLWLFWMVALYFCFVHLPRHKHSAFLLKPLVVGLVFAAGTLLPVWMRAGLPLQEEILASLMFAALCSLNCFAIHRWESETEREPAAPSAPPHRGSSSQFLVASLAGLSVVCAFAAVNSHAPRLYEPLFFALGIGTTSLLLLHFLRGEFQAETLRVLADLALVLPALLLVLGLL